MTAVIKPVFTVCVKLCMQILCEERWWTSPSTDTRAVAHRINCIHMPTDGFPSSPEFQFKQRLCNIWLGRSSGLQGERRYMEFVQQVSVPSWEKAFKVHTVSSEVVAMTKLQKQRSGRERAALFSH